MCRMIASLGDVPGEELLVALVAMARGENELQELNCNFGQFQHGDGWGVVYVIFWSAARQCGPHHAGWPGAQRLGSEIARPQFLRQR